ncbi:MAG: DUF3379 domain-containing protein [Gammaproteobacteria bacterium]|nr:DUF3379 domain-containing protein [Gammaproteobacteria bacterium]
MNTTTDTMNCDEYKLAIAADPDFDGGAEHASGCADCRDYRDTMRSLNVDIAGALQLDVPPLQLPELPEIDADNVVALESRRAASRPAWLALAASVLLAAVIGVRMFGVGVEYESLADEVLAHLDHEPASLRPSSTAVSDERLAATVPANIARMDHSAGLITYARSCEINGKTVPHLVIQGQYGPVMILLMPQEPVAKVVSLDGENVHGAILPVGDGSIAIIGAREEPLERIEKSVLKSVMWST